MRDRAQQGKPSCYCANRDGSPRWSSPVRKLGKSHRADHRPIGAHAGCFSEEAACAARSRVRVHMKSNTHSDSFAWHRRMNPQMPWSQWWSLPFVCPVGWQTTQPETVRSVRDNGTRAVCQSLSPGAVEHALGQNSGKARSDRSEDCRWAQIHRHLCLRKAELPAPTCSIREDHPLSGLPGKASQDPGVLYTGGHEPLGWHTTPSAQAAGMLSILSNHRKIKVFMHASKGQLVFPVDVGPIYKLRTVPWMQAQAGWPNIDPLWICVPHITVTLNKQQRFVHPWTAFWLWSMPGESPFTVAFQIICTITHIYDHFILEIESGIKEQHHSTQINIIDERTIGAHSKLLHSNFSDLRCFLAYSSTSCYSLTPPCHRMLALLSWLEQDTTNSMPSWSMPQPPNLIRLTMIGDQIVQKWTSVPTKKVKWQIFQIDIQTRRWFLFPKICFQNLGERTPSKKGRKRNV